MPRPVSHNVTVSERPKGSGRYALRWREGGKQREQKGYTDREDAEAAASKKRRELRSPFSAARTSSTVGQLAAQWYDDLVAPSAEQSKLKPGTRQLYERHLGILLLTDVAKMRAADLTTPMVNRWIKSLQQPESTKRQLLVVLSSIYRYAMEDGLGGVEANPVIGAKRPPSQRQTVYIPSMDDVVRLAIATPSPAEEWRAFLLVCAFCGLRQQEAFALRPMDVSPSHLHVRRAVSGQNGHIETTKTEKGNRRVPLPGFVYEALRLAMSNQWALAETDLIWATTKHGGPWNRSTFNANVWRSWREASGVDVKWRHLRHFYVSQLAASGANMLQVSRWAGHSKSSFTLDVYGFLFDEDEAGVLDALTARITG